MSDINDWQEVPAHSKIDDWTELPALPGMHGYKPLIKPAGLNSENSQALVDYAKAGMPKGYQPSQNEMSTYNLALQSGLGAGGDVVADRVPKAASGLADFLQPAAKRSEVLDVVKDSKQVEPYVQGKVNEAAEMFNKKQIGPRMLEQEARLKGNTLRINPEEFRGISPELDKYVESVQVAKPDPYGIYGRSGGAVSTGREAIPGEPAPQTVVTHGYQSDVPVAPNTDAAGYSTLESPTARPSEPKPASQPFTIVKGEATPGVPGQGMRQMEPMGPSPTESSIEIPAEEGLKIRRMLNDATDWRKNPVDPSKVSGLNQRAASLHQKLADQFETIDPAMPQLSEEMKGAYNTQKLAIGRAGNNPINTVLTKDTTPGIAKEGRLSRFDEMAGSDLTGLGKDISTAKDRLQTFTSPKLKKLVHPLAALGEAYDMATVPALRSYDAAAQVAEPRVRALSDMLSTPAAKKLIKTGTSLGYGAAAKAGSDEDQR